MSGKRPRRREDNIKLDFTEIRCEGREWTELAYGESGGADFCKHSN